MVLRDFPKQARCFWEEDRVIKCVEAVKYENVYHLGTQEPQR